MPRHTLSRIALTLTTLTLSACAVQETLEVESRPAFDEVNYWDRYKENCEDVLRDPYAFNVPRIEACGKLWETYAEVSQLNLPMRSLYAVGFSRLYHEGNEGQRMLASNALTRLCIPAHPLGANRKVVETPPPQLDCTGGLIDIAGATDSQEIELTAEAMAAMGSTIVYVEGAAPAGDPDERIRDNIRRQRAIVKPRPAPSRRASRLAATETQKGIEHIKKGEFVEAIGHFDDALEHDPYHADAKYGLARAYTMTGEYELAITTLTDLYSWDSPGAVQRLLDARREANFRALRDDLRFKVITGYRRMTVLNGAGEDAVPQLTRAVRELIAKNHTVERIGNDRHPRLSTVIFYDPVFEQQASELRRVIGDPSITLTPIDWQTRDDFIIAWGGDGANALIADSGQAAPNNQGEPAVDPDDALDSALSELEALRSRIEGVKSQAEGIGGDIAGQL